MSAKAEAHLDLAVPGLMLDLGRVVSESRSGVRRRSTGVADHVDKVGALEERVLAMVKADRAARKAVGIRDGGQDAAEQGVRLRAFALLAYRMLHEPQPSTPDMAEIAAAASDPRCPPGEAVLAARHALGRMVAERLLEALPDGRSPFNPRLAPSQRGLRWLGGGRASLAVLSPRKLAALLSGARQEGGDGEDVLLPDPLPARAIRDRIATRIVGLDGGQLDVVSSRLAMHMVRSKMLAAGEDPGTPNECVLVLGESGTGKTWFCHQAGLATGLPWAMANAAEMTASGYVGLSAEDGLRDLYVAAKGKAEVCRHGIMTYDEITKRATSLNESPVNSSAVLNEMLRIVQGQVTQVGGKRGGYEPPFWVNTYGMFFFLCGHAPGLDRLLQRRMGRKSIGYGQSEGRRGTRALLVDALEDYGLIPELLNRLTAVVVVPPPSLENLIQAALASNGVIESYGRLMGEAMLVFDERAVVEMARHSLETRQYYRGLAAIASAVAADAVAREEKGAVLVSPADVRRAVARMDDGVSDLLSRPGHGSGGPLASGGSATLDRGGAAAP